MYPETTTMINLPTFVTHNPDTKDFTVQKITNSALIGEYMATIISQICVPEDHTKSQCTVMKV